MILNDIELYTVTGLLFIYKNKKKQKNNVKEFLEIVSQPCKFDMHLVAGIDRNVLILPSHFFCGGIRKEQQVIDTFDLKDI